MQYENSTSRINKDLRVWTECQDSKARARHKNSRSRTGCENSKIRKKLGGFKSLGQDVKI